MSQEATAKAPLEVAAGDRFQGRLKEYEDASNNARHYANLQFAKLTAFLAVTAGLMTLVFMPAATPDVRWVLSVCGIASAVFFFAADVSNICMWTRFVQRAADLEKALEFQQYPSLPGAPKFFLVRPGTLAIWAIFVTIGVFWLWLAVASPEVVREAPVKP